jgi:hypothetical protein
MRHKLFNDAKPLRRIRFPKRIIGWSSYMKALLAAQYHTFIELHDVPEDIFQEMIVVGMLTLSVKVVSTRPPRTYREMSCREIAACAYCGEENLTEGPCASCGGPRIHFDYLTTTR